MDAEPFGAGFNDPTARPDAPASFDPDHARATARQVDGLLKTHRVSKAPKPRSLAQFVLDYGGIRDDDSPEARDLKTRLKDHRRLRFLFHRRPRAVTCDVMLEACRAEGYFYDPGVEQGTAPQLMIHDLTDALVDEIDGGHRLYREADRLAIQTQTAFETARDEAQRFQDDVAAVIGETGIALEDLTDELLAAIYYAYHEDRLSLPEAIIYAHTVDNDALIHTVRAGAILGQ